MHTLFDLVPHSLQGIQNPAQWPYVRQGLRNNIERICNYYRGNPQSVKSDHLLVKLIESVNIPLSLSYERYFSNVDAVSLDLSMTLKLTSSLYKGQLWNGVFYGPGSSEIIIAHTDGFNLEEARKNWQEVTAVRVLRHAKSDLWLNLPDGARTSTESGIAVIAINVPLLMCQYYAFRQAYWLKPEDQAQYTTMMFVHMYVLPNMLYSHLDYALFNRIVHLSKKLPMGQVLRRPAFALIDYAVKVDQVYTEVLGNLKGQEKNLVGILQNVPAVTRSDMEQVMHLPDMAPTRQVLWALAVARLPVLDFILSQTHVTPATKNQSEIDTINRTFMRWQQARFFEGVMPADVQADVIEEINAIREKANPSQRIALFSPGT